MGKKILYILIIIALIVAGIFVAKQMSEEKEVTQTGANTIKNTTGNTITNNTEKNEMVENNTIEPEVNKIENNNIETGTTELSPKEQAIQIVKENWGEDETVYFSYDGIKDGKHVVCVRESSTTKELYRYYVDIETGSFEIE